MKRVHQLLRSQRLIVSCGTGGVGKTTVSAALAFAAARMGRHVLVLTIDPARRLAEVLSLANRPQQPVPLPRATLDGLGVSAGTRVDAWMLDPMRVADDTVRSVVSDQRMAQQFLNNPIYRQLSAMTAGMQEYTAMKALYGFVRDGRYDLVVLDTPPSRHALDFLDAPSRMAAFFEGRVFRAFVPQKRSLLRSAAARLIRYVLRTVAGKGFANNLLSFLAQFTGVFGSFEQDVARMRQLLSGPESAFLLVTSPADEALQEALLFRRQVRERELPFAGFVLNQSRVHRHDWAVPEQLDTAEGTPIASETVRRLKRLAEGEQRRALRDLAALERLRHEADGAAVCDLPLLSNASDGLRGLDQLASILAESDGTAALPGLPRAAG